MTDDRVWLEKLKKNRPRPLSRASAGLGDRIWRSLQLEPTSVSRWWGRMAIPGFVIAVAVVTNMWMTANTTDPADLSLAQDVEWAFTSLEGEDGEGDPAGIFLDLAGGI